MLLFCGTYAIRLQGTYIYTVQYSLSECNECNYRPQCTTEKQMILEKEHQHTTCLQFLAFFNMVYDKNICKLALDICILNPEFLSKSPLEPLFTTNVGAMVQYIYCTYTYCVKLKCCTMCNAR